MSGSDRSRQAPARGIALVRALIRTMRPKQWIKNSFVFAAIAFSEGRLWTQPESIMLACGAFAVFSLAASAIYLINDPAAVEKDRAHPHKRHRPLASGELPGHVAGVASVILLVVALIGAALLDSREGFDPGLLIVIAIYLLVQGLLYTYWLKHLVILDVFTIAAGFVLRAIAGAVVLDIGITPWLLICMGSLALFLGLGKRRAELVLLEGSAGSHRKILDEYSLPMLDQMLSLVTALTLMAYTLFTFSATTLPREPYPVMLTTVPFVVYAIFRYLYLIHHRGGGGSPEELVLRDRPLALSILLYGAVVLTVFALYPA